MEALLNLIDRLKESDNSAETRFIDEGDCMRIEKLVNGVWRIHGVCSYECAEKLGYRRQHD